MCHSPLEDARGWKRSASNGLSEMSSISIFNYFLNTSLSILTVDITYPRCLLEVDVPLHLYYTCFETNFFFIKIYDQKIPFGALELELLLL